MCQTQSLLGYVIIMSVGERVESKILAKKSYGNSI